MKKKENRSNQILELLSAEERIEVTELSRLLGVSQVTVRKDLDAMENLGIVKREHGFALLVSSNDIQGRLAYHYEEKRKIAARAAELVPERSTIMVESGSCCALLVDFLAETRKNLTVITNSAFIASYIRSKAVFQVILLGGTYQKESQVMVGPMVRQCAENFLVDMFFIGVDGYSERTGFTNQDQMRAQAVRDMSGQAERIIVLTESEKFLKHGTVPMNLDGKVKTVITDSRISEETRMVLQLHGIETITV